MIITEKLSKNMEKDEEFRFGLDYIIKNIKDLPSESSLSRYEPKENWFLRNSKGLHGIGHSARVLVLADILARLKTGYSIDTINWAAATHDTQRMQDGLDSEHGLRSSNWIYTLLNKDYPEIDKISYLNQWHDAEDSDVPEMFEALRILKDADGLDRWRLVKPRIELLRTSESLKIVPVAKYLQRISYALKEQDGIGEYESVINAGKKIGIIK